MQTFNLDLILYRKLGFFQNIQKLHYLSSKDTTKMTNDIV